MGASGWVVTLWLATLSCSDGQVEAPADTRQECIYGGRAEDTLAGLSPAQRQAIVKLAVVGTAADGGELADSCSGVLSAPRWVLSAAHCIEGLENVAVTTQFYGAPAASSDACAAQPASVARAGSSRVIRHPTLDALLIELDSAVADFGIAAEPLLLAEPPDDLERDTAVELAGYGWTEDDAPGGLRFVVERVTALDDDWVEVSGAGETGACLGDSGGPLLQALPDGPRVAGILSRGSASCTGTDRYTRASTLWSWHAETTAE